MGHVLNGVLQLKFNKRSEERRLVYDEEFRESFMEKFNFQLEFKKMVEIEQTWQGKGI